MPSSHDVRRVIRRLLRWMDYLQPRPELAPPADPGERVETFRVIVPTGPEGRREELIAQVGRLLEQGKDEIDICHELGLRRWQLGSLGFPTGPWTGEGWNALATRRGYPELVYRLLPGGDA